VSRSEGWQTPNLRFEGRRPSPRGGCATPSGRRSARLKRTSGQVFRPGRSQESNPRGAARMELRPPAAVLAPSAEDRMALRLPARPRTPNLRFEGRRPSPRGGCATPSGRRSARLKRTSGQVFRPGRSQESNPRGAARIRTGDKGFAVLCLTTWPRRRSAKGSSAGDRVAPPRESGKPDSNRRPPPWQGGALPTELFPHGCEPGT
jgi:hypothetical protein